MGEKAVLYGIGFEKTTVDEAAEKALALIRNGRPASAVTPNPEIFWSALHDDVLYSALTDADLVLPDGIGVLLASRILGDPIPQKVAGVEFGEAILSRAAKSDISVYFLGAKPGVAEKAVERMKEKYASLHICGTHDGYFSDPEPILEEIRKSGADIVFVCLGSPKQEKFIASYKEKTGAKLHLALGGSLDVYAGYARRAPQWMIRCGLEWLYRLIKEPKRIKRMAQIPRFLLLCVKTRLKGQHKGK